MSRWYVTCILVLYALTGLSAARPAVAAEYHGTVMFGGLPVPGATITAKQGTKSFATITDEGGVYSFADLPDGQWAIEVAMQGFVVIDAQVNVAAQTPAGNWELSLLTTDQLTAQSKAAPLQVAPVPVLIPPASAKKPDNSAQTNAPVDMPKAPESSDDRSADGFLIQGNESNAATSRYSISQAIGNTRSGAKALYTGSFASIFDNSALDARPYSISGLEAPKDSYNRITGVFTIGGPIKIPRLLPRGPNFFVSYQWTRDATASILTSLVPTAAERTGNLSGLTNTQGQPVTVYDPATGAPYNGNVVPVSTQAGSLLQLYPMPNISGVSDNSGISSYNYQAPVLNSSHQDSLQSRIEPKSLGRKDQLYGGFNFQSTRASALNLFDFVDTTDTLGLNGNIHWTHRFNAHLFLFSGYTFSRLRTLVDPNFDNRENVSGAAGIAGNDQSPADWGPPALSFSSGIAALGDANSAFNRNETNAASLSALIYRGRHSITIGGDFRKQDYNDFFEQDPRGSFAFTGAATTSASAATATGSDLADFLIGIPDTSAIAYGNADKYFREPVYDLYFTDDWRVLPTLTVNAGARWEYDAPITELKGRLVNLDVASGFSAAAPVVGSNSVGSLTGAHYPSSLIRPDFSGFEPRIGISWHPIAASTIVVRAGYGIYHDTSVYQNIVLSLAQQSPLSTSQSVANSSACPLTLAAGFMPCATVSQDTFAIDPNFRIGYAQTWQLAVQRDLPFALQMTATYLGVKGTHGPQQFLPNSYPIGESNPCPSCPAGFVYQDSNGNSTRQAGQLQLRRRLRSGFAGSLMYTYSKSIDDDAYLGGAGHVTASTGGQAQSASLSIPPGAIAQNWLDPHAERALSTFDQRHLLNVQAQYTSGEGLGGGTLLNGWRGRALKEWTVLSTIAFGTGLPQTPVYPLAVPGTGFSSVIRPDLTGASVYNSGARPHLNAAAFEAPVAGQWGTAGRDSITGPDQFSLNASLARTFRLKGRYSLDVRIDSTNPLNHAVFTGWNTAWTPENLQFGEPVSAGSMRSLQSTMRLRF